MTLRRSRGGHKAAHTRKKKQLESLKRPRFARLSPEEIVKQLRHRIDNNLIPWTPELVKLVVDNAAKQGIVL